MILHENEANFLRQNRRILEPMLLRRIEEFKELILQEEDEEKRDKLIKWVKEFKNGLGAIYQIDKNKEDNFTGI